MTAAKKTSDVHGTAAATGDAADDNAAAVRKEFLRVVNMPADELAAWLKTRESHVVGAKDGKTGTSAAGPESVGHRSGRRIVVLLGKDAGSLTKGDVAHMRKVVGYVHRHLAQRPAGEEVEASRWRYSLMNWGHDPSR